MVSKYVTIRESVCLEKTSAKNKQTIKKNRPISCFTVHYPTERSLIFNFWYVCVKGPIKWERHVTLFPRSHLVPRTDDPSGEHEEVTHGNQAAPDEQGEEAEELLKDRLDADQDEDGEEDGQCSGHSDEEGYVVLHGLKGGFRCLLLITLCTVSHIEYTVRKKHSVKK